jgi:spore germination protein GerM
LSEGGYNPTGKPFSISNGITGITAPTAGTETPLLAIRGNSAPASSTNNRYYHQNVIPTLLNVFTEGTDNVFYTIRLYLAPNTPTVTTWNAVDASNSVVQYAVGPGITAINPTTSIVVDTGYAAGRGGTVLSALESIYSNTLQITSNISNVSDVILITARRITGNDPKVYASITWQEVY